jgi:hypothetical protein
LVNFDAVMLLIDDQFHALIVRPGAKGEGLGSGLGHQA